MKSGHTWPLGRKLELVVSVLLLLGCGTASSANNQSWPADMPGFVHPKPGEHPRLFFRKSQLPELKRRFETPEGKAIVGQLRRLLGNDGESLPEHWNQHYPVNIGPKGHKELLVGASTIGHPAGYGLLYQLTGRTKYAQLARRSLERMFDDRLYSVTADVIQKERGDLWQPKGPRFDGEELSQVITTYGQPDRDERYTWTRPGAKLRLGALMTCVAMAYDLCYEAWDDDFRLRVVKEIVDYNRLPVDYDKYAEGHKGSATMDTQVNCSYPPTSNHFGAYIGGAGVALLAVRNDRGADADRIEPWLDKIEEQAIRLMTEGFGDHGFYAEGHGPSHMAVNTAFIPFLQAARTAWGKDFITPRPNAQWLTLRWAMEVIPGGDKPWYPNYHPSSYGSDFVDRDSMSHEGEWAQGFGALANDDQKAAMLWMYEQAMEKQRPLVKYDAWIYPHRAVLAFVNWPVDLDPKNPGEVIGHVNADRYMGHYMFRKQWKDANDIYFTFFLNPMQKHGYVKGPRGGNFAFYGYGLRRRWSSRLPSPRKEVHFDSMPDGSGVLCFEWGEDRQVTCIAVDYSGKPGAGGVAILANPWFTAKDRTKTHWRRLLPVTRKDGKAALTFQDVTVQGVPVFLMIMHEGDAPHAVVEGDTIRLGLQRYRFDGRRISME